MGVRLSRIKSESNFMMEQISQHSKIWINEAGQEVYPPTNGHPENLKKVKPQSEWQIRTDGMPPKSWAEVQREAQAEQDKQLDEQIGDDEEARKAVELLKSKGLL